MMSASKKENCFQRNSFLRERKSKSYSPTILLFCFHLDDDNDHGNDTDDEDDDDVEDNGEPGKIHSGSFATSLHRELG